MATVPKSDRTTIITLASATAGPFDLTFRLFDDDRLAVFVNDIARTDFTISSNYVDGFDDNATIIFDGDLAVSDVVRVHSDMTAARSSEYQNGPGLTEKLNIELARVWAVLSDLKRDTGRSVKVFEPIDPIAIQSRQVLVGNLNGDGIEFGPNADALLAAEANANDAAALARRWAEGTLPGGADTYSAREYSELLQSPLLIPISHDDVGVTMAIGSFAFVSETTSPYDAITIEVR